MAKIIIKNNVASRAKNLFYCTIQVVPLPLIRILMSESIKNRYCYWLVSRSQFSKAIDSFIEFKFPRNNEGKSFARPVIISGPPRAGKSILSKRLSHLLKYNMLDTDTSRYLYQHIDDDHRRHEVKTELYLRAITACEGKIVLEGATFIGDNKDGYEMEKKLGPTLYIAKLSNSKLYILGCPDDEAEKKLQAIKRDSLQRRPWVEGLSDEELVSLTKKTISRSVELKQYSLENGISYFDIHENNFKDDIDNALTSIIPELGISYD